MISGRMLMLNAGRAIVARDDPVDLESAEEIRHDLHEKHWPVSIVASFLTLGCVPNVNFNLKSP